MLESASWGGGVCSGGGSGPRGGVWILRARDRDRDILARLRFGHQRPLNRRCPDELGHQRPVNRGCPWVSKPVSQDIQSICYCLHTGIFCLDTCDLVVAGVRISISPKYLYLYLALKVLTGGVWFWGGVCYGGCLIRGGGCLVPGGVSALGVSQHDLRQTPSPPLWTESQTPVKTLPWPNFVAADKKKSSEAFQ